METFLNLLGEKRKYSDDFSVYYTVGGILFRFLTINLFVYIEVEQMVPSSGQFCLGLAGSSR